MQRGFLPRCTKAANELFAEFLSGIGQSRDRGENNFAIDNDGRQVLTEERLRGTRGDHHDARPEAEGTTTQCGHYGVRSPREGDHNNTGFYCVR